jgi:hypothetical protein
MCVSRVERDIFGSFRSGYTFSTCNPIRKSYAFLFNRNKNYSVSYMRNSKIPLNRPQYLESYLPGKRQGAIWEATEINYLNFLLYNADLV